MGFLIVDPDHWAVIVRTDAEETPWRIACGEPAHLEYSKEAIMYIMSRLPAKYDKLLPESKKGYTVEMSIHISLIKGARKRFAKRESSFAAM